MLVVWGGDGDVMEFPDVGGYFGASLFMFFFLFLWITSNIFVRFLVIAHVLFKFLLFSSKYVLIIE